MADYDVEAARSFKNGILERVRSVEAGIDADVLNYYAESGMRDEVETQKVLDGIHKYLKIAYDRLGDILTSIENY